MKEQVLSDKQRRAKRIYGIVGIAAKRMDWVDIIASVISGCYTYVLYLLFRFKHIGGYKE